MIRLTKRAVEQTLHMQGETPRWQGQGLRLWVSGKNCEGLLYGVTFDKPSPEDRVIIQNGIAILVDPDTARYVEGSEIDFVDDERGQGYLVDNPNKKRFAGKFYLRDTP